MKLVHSIAYSALILIGIIHTVFTTFTFDAFSIEALWFAGSGLAILFAGLTNVLFRENCLSKLSYRVNQLANILLLALVISINKVLLMVPGVVGLLALLVLIVTTWKIHNTSIKQQSGVS